MEIADLIKEAELTFPDWTQLIAAMRRGDPNVPAMLYYYHPQSKSYPEGPTPWCTSHGEDTLRIQARRALHEKWLELKRRVPNR